MVYSPKEYADNAIEDIVFGTSACDVKKTMVAIALMSTNAEAAFYEKEIDEDELVEYTNIVEEHIAKFNKKCNCSKK